MAEKENNPGKPPVPESSLKSKRKITSSASASNLSFFLRERSSSGDLVEAAAAAAARAKRRVCVLLTGGTMAMRARKDGTLAPSPGYLAAQMRAMPELREARMPEYDVIEYGTLIDSADMLPSDWSMIADDVRRHYADYDGFVVIMGTDTMAYCASALSFMLETLSKVCRREERTFPQRTRSLSFSRNVPSL